MSLQPRRSGSLFSSFSFDFGGGVGDLSEDCCLLFLRLLSLSLLLEDRLLLFLVLDFFLFFSFPSLDLLRLLLLVIVINRDLLRLRDLLPESFLDCLYFLELLMRFLKSLGDRCRGSRRLSGLDFLRSLFDLSLEDVRLPLSGLPDDLSLLPLSPLILPGAG